MRTRRPPALLRGLLRLLVPAELRDTVEGDLCERFERIADQRGEREARRWAWRQLRDLRPLALRRAVRHERRGGEGTMGSLRSWIGSVWRMARGRPAAAGTVVGTVALAIAGTTVAFSVVNGVLLKPLPYPEPDRLVRLWQVNQAWLDSPNSQLRAFGRYFPLDVVTMREWEEGDLGLSAIGAWSDRRFVDRADAGATVVPGEAVTSGIFPALGIDPLLGRTLLPEDDAPGAARVAVISEGIWRDRFGGRGDILGVDWVLDGIPHTIVGVMPEDFALPDNDGRVWTPLWDEEKAGDRSSQFLSVVGRLAADVTREAAHERVVAIQNRLNEEYDAEFGARTESLLDVVVGDVRRTLLFLLGAVGLVLLIACVNIANVLSVAALDRRRQLAVKTALGASRRRVIGDLLAESVGLGLVGGVLGVVLAALTLPAMLALLPQDLPRIDEVGLDATVVLFGLIVTTLTAAVVGTLPALHASDVTPGESIRSSRGSIGDRRTRAVRSALVVGEVAAAFVLIFGAGLLARSFVALASTEKGFDSSGLVMVSAYPNEVDHPTRDDRLAFSRELRARLSTIPGTEVAAANQVPLMGSMSTTSFEVEVAGGEPEDVNVVIAVVTDGYHDVMRIPLLQGRGIESTDVDGAPLVGVANRAMAEAYWPGENPIGKRMRTGGDDAEWTTIVGVAENVRHQGLDVEPEPKLYVPLEQNHRQPSHWLVRASTDLEAVAGLARDAVGAVSPGTPVQRVTVVEDEVSRGVAVPRFRTAFSLALAGLAALLALLGVYGVVAFAVGQRSREIGVRMALGARESSVLWAVIASGLRLGGWGLGIGLLVAWFGAPLLGDFLHEVSPRDPVTLIGIGLGVTAIVVLAAWIPARRAAAIDPAGVLRSE